MPDENKIEIRAYSPLLNETMDSDGHTFTLDYNMTPQAALKKAGVKNQQAVAPGHSLVVHSLVEELLTREWATGELSFFRRTGMAWPLGVMGGRLWLSKAFTTPLRFVGVAGPMPRPLNSIDDSPAPVFPLQFRLRQGFIVMTGVAIGCGLVAWLDSACLVLLFVACGPTVTFLTLNRTGGECRGLAVILGASVQALLIGGVLFVYEVLPAIFANASANHVLNLLVAPINFGLVGGVLSLGCVASADRSVASRAWEPAANARSQGEPAAGSA